MPTNDMAAIEERFQAAVNVIKGLPKNGPYQPSTGMMLKFYGLFKQATEGACEQKKPGFWDVVGRAKWDAWVSNRHLSKEQAMQRYVDSLKEIIETMSFTENVQNFVGSLSGLENINLDELELISPGMRELAESHPSSPFNSRTNSPQHGVSANTTPSTEELSSEQLSQLASTTASKSTAHQNGHLANGHAMNGYADQGSMTTNHTTNDALLNYNTNNNITAAVDPSDDEYDDPYDLNHDLTVAVSQNTELLKQIQSTVLRMNADMSAVSLRMSSLERTLQDVRNAQQLLRGAAVGKTAIASRRYPVWWPFGGISPGWFLLLVLWPFVVKRFARMLDTNTRRR